MNKYMDKYGVLSWLFALMIGSIAVVASVLSGFWFIFGLSACCVIFDIIVLIKEIWKG